LGARFDAPKSDPQVSEFIAGFAGSHRYVLDYLTDEVLLQESREVQSWLLQTSILNRMSGPLCDAVTGHGNGQRMLERLDAANLFIVPLDGERRWYRHHGLFAELLRRRLEEQSSTETNSHRQTRSSAGASPQRLDPPTLHRRASEWYEHSDLIEEAIMHAMAGEDLERAAALVERHAVRQMTQHRREAALAEWLDALPQELVQSRPWLCVYLGWARYWRGLRDQVEPCLQAAEEALPAPEEAPQAAGHTSPRAADELSSADNTRLVAGYISSIRAHHALTNQDIPRVIEMANRALACLPEGDYMRCEAAVALGGAHWSQGDVMAAQRAFARARATAARTGYPAMAVPSSCYVAEQQTKRGKLYEAEATYREAMHWATAPRGRLLPVAGFPLIKLGDLAREWNDLDAARHHLLQGIELCRQLGQADVLVEGHVMLARLHVAQGRADQARNTLREADQVANRSKIDPWIVAWADEIRVRLWLSEGNLLAALRWAQESGLRLDGQPSYQRDLDHINLARVLIAQGVEQSCTAELVSAQKLLDQLLAAATQAGWVHEQIRILVLKALAYQAQKDACAALSALEQALVLGNPGGYVRTFVDEGVPMGQLLHVAAAQGIQQDYASRLLGAFEFQVAERESSSLQPDASLRLVEPLSGRELEVLGLIAEGMTNREIGQQLYISQGTVKAHTSNIYGKLGVRSRTQAVVCAQNLGLLVYRQ
jgi:LuxR family maltose regulon positive regulatory protein